MSQEPLGKAHQRPYHARGRKVPGVFQRCFTGCPDPCAAHTWSFHVELPPGLDGKRRQETGGGFASGKAAAAARAKVVSSDRDGLLARDARKTFGEWLEEWIEAKVKRGEIRDSTERGYRDNIKNHLKPRLGTVRLAELRGVDLTRTYAKIATDREAEIATARALNEQYAAEAEVINAERRRQGLKRMVAPKRVPVPRPVSPASIARIHAVVCGALGDAVPDLIPRSVAGDAKLPKVTKKKVRPPSPDTYGALLDELEQDRWYALILIAGYSGLRRGELCGLKWEHIDMDTGRIVLGPQRTSVGYKIVVGEAKTEAGDERIVWLDGDALAALKVWRLQQKKEKLAWGADYNNEGYVFTREDGEPLHPDRVTKVVKRTLVRHGLTKSKLHDLRHFRASALISSGVEIAKVSKIMGHKNISVTNDLYGNLFDEAGKAASEQAQGIVPRKKRRSA